MFFKDIAISPQLNSLSDKIKKASEKKMRVYDLYKNDEIAKLANMSEAVYQFSGTASDYEFEEYIKEMKHLIQKHRPALEMMQYVKQKEEKWVDIYNDKMMTLLRDDHVLPKAWFALGNQVFDLKKKKIYYQVANNSIADISNEKYTPKQIAYKNNYNQYIDLDAAVMFLDETEFATMYEKIKKGRKTLNINKKFTKKEPEISLIPDEADSIVKIEADISIVNDKSETPMIKDPSQISIIMNKESEILIKEEKSELLIEEKVKKSLPRRRNNHHREQSARIVPTQTIKREMDADTSSLVIKTKQEKIFAPLNDTVSSTTTNKQSNREKLSRISTVGTLPRKQIKPEPSLMINDPMPSKIKKYSPKSLPRTSTVGTLPRKQIQEKTFATNDSLLFTTVNQKSKLETSSRISTDGTQRRNRIKQGRSVTIKDSQVHTRYKKLHEEKLSTISAFETLPRKQNIKKEGTIIREEKISASANDTMFLVQKKHTRKPSRSVKQPSSSNINKATHTKSL